MNTKTIFNGSLAVAFVAVAVAVSLFGAALAHADVAPTVTTVVLDANNVATTSAQIGSLVHASVSIASSTGSTTPSGTVNFSLFQNTTCASTATVQSGVALIGGVASSSATTLPASGLSYLVHYNGDINYPSGDGVCQAVATSTPVAIVSGPGTIGGVVFNDLNTNDVKDASDPGLSGWTVWLHTGSGAYNSPITATAITDANGNYSFGTLSTGTYFVEEQQPSGWDQTTSDMVVSLNNANSSATVNFANIMMTDGSDGHGNHGGDGDNRNGNDHATSTDQGHGKDGGDNGMATSTDQGHGKNGNDGNNNNGNGNNDNNGNGNNNGRHTYTAPNTTNGKSGDNNSGYGSNGGSGHGNNNGGHGSY